MKRDVTAALRLALQGHLSLRKSRLESFCVLVVGVLLSRTVNLSHLALHVSHTSRDRLKLPPSPTLLRTGHLRRKPARPSDRPDRRRWIGAVASGPRPHVLEVWPLRHQYPDVGDHP